MKRAKFEEIHGKLPPNVSYIDLDAQPQPAPEVVTAGWTDTHIRGKTIVELDAMINSAELGIGHLETALESERQRVDGLRRIKRRKNEIGD